MRWTLDAIYSIKVVAWIQSYSNTGFQVAVKIFKGFFKGFYFENKGFLRVFLGNNISKKYKLCNVKG